MLLSDYICDVLVYIFFLIIRLPPILTRTDPLFPYPPLFRSLLLHRHPDVDRRRRAWPHPGWQQQRLPARQRDLVDRLERRQRVAGRLRDHQGRPAPAARAPGTAPAALVRGASRHPGRPEGPGLVASLGPGDDR